MAASSGWAPCGPGHCRPPAAGSPYEWPLTCLVAQGAGGGATCGRKGREFEGPGKLSLKSSLSHLLAAVCSVGLVTLYWAGPLRRVGELGVSYPEPGAPGVTAVSGAPAPTLPPLCPFSESHGTRVSVKERCGEHTVWQLVLEPSVTCRPCCRPQARRLSSSSFKSYS